MADRNNNGLYFIVGGIVVVVALLFFFMSGTNTGDGTVDTAPAATGTAPAAGGDTVIIDTPDTGAAASPDVSVEPAPADPATTPTPAN
jgi:hypothetical protein